MFPRHKQKNFPMTNKLFVIRFLIFFQISITFLPRKADAIHSSTPHNTQKPNCHSVLLDSHHNLYTWWKMKHKVFWLNLINHRFRINRILLKGISRIIHILFSKFLQWQLCQCNDLIQTQNEVALLWLFSIKFNFQVFCC